MKPSEWMVLSFIIRKTKGWHKEHDAISYSQFIKGTGISSNSTIKKCLDSLIEKGLVILGTTGHKADAHHYMLNKDYSFSITENVERPVTFSVERPVTKTVDTKETIKESNKYIYKNDGIATDSQINPIVSAMQKVSKQKLHSGSKDKYDDVATTIYSLGATPDLVAGFGEWWKENCWYKTPSKAALATIADEWERYMESTRPTETKPSVPIKSPGRWDGTKNAYVPMNTGNMDIIASGGING